MLTIERVKELAMENYCKGGDTIVECYEDKEIQELIDRGVNTEAKLLKMFREQYEIDEEYRQAAKWHAYGTTDDEEIKQMLNFGSEESETEEEIDDEEFDPCFGCQARGSYNCKHCQYGDDGNYSVYDVYTPAELGIKTTWR